MKLYERIRKTQFTFFTMFISCYETFEHICLPTDKDTFLEIHTLFPWVKLPKHLNIIPTSLVKSNTTPKSIRKS